MIPLLPLTGCIVVLSGKPGQTERSLWQQWQPGWEHEGRGTCLMVLTVFLLLLFCLSQWLQRHLTIVNLKKRCNIENLTDETLFQEKGGALTAIFKKSLKRSESPPSEEVSCALFVFISWYPLSRENEPCCVKFLKKPLQSCHWSSLLLQPLLRRHPTLSAQIVKL